MISMGRSGTFLGFVVAASLSGASPALATSTSTPVIGSMGPTQETCLQGLTTAVGDRSVIEALREHVEVLTARRDETQDPTALRHVALVRYDAFADVGGRRDP